VPAVMLGGNAKIPARRDKNAKTRKTGTEGLRDGGAGGKRKNGETQKRKNKKDVSAVGRREDNPAKPRRGVRG